MSPLCGGGRVREGWLPFPSRAEPGTRLCQNSLVSCTIALPTVQRRCLSVWEPCTSMGHIHGAHRHDVILFPERLDDDIAADNPVRFLDACVDELDLVACGFRRAGGDRAPRLCAGRSLAALPLWRSLPPAFEPSPCTGGAAPCRIAVARQEAPACPQADGALSQAPSGAPAPSLPHLHAAV
jgi:hypothetical protein